MCRHVRLFMCISVYQCNCVCIQMYVCARKTTYAYVCVCLWICMSLTAYICAFVLTHVYFEVKFISCQYFFSLFPWQNLSTSPPAAAAAPSRHRRRTAIHTYINSPLIYGHFSFFASCYTLPRNCWSFRFLSTHKYNVVMFYGIFENPLFAIFDFTLFFCPFFSYFFLYFLPLLF